ncbi:MAG: conjugal transfer protein TraX, partial [Oscillospiraceae bacterium]|nr:conjugal transfer protein TraX [Oscillospiraceae bacterium]
MAIDISNRRDRPIRKYTIQPKRKSGITADLLKLIAIIAMVIDHIAWAFVPFGSVAGQAMHVIGRLTAPIMCFMVAEGYAHTRDPIKYAKRLGLFALISHIPYIYFESGGFPVIHQTSVMFPLFLGLVALIVRDSPKYEIAVKNMILLIICLVAMIGDWGATAVIWIQV